MFKGLTWSLSASTLKDHRKPLEKAKHVLKHNKHLSQLQHDKVLSGTLYNKWALINANLQWKFCGTVYYTHINIKWVNCEKCYYRKYHRNYQGIRNYHTDYVLTGGLATQSWLSDFCLWSPAATLNAQNSQPAKKKWAKGLLFCKKKYSNRHKWQHHGTLTAWQIPQIRWCVLFCPLISWKPEETAIKCKCRTSPEKVVEHVMSLFELLVILMLTNMKSILAYNMKHHKYMLFWGMLTKIVAPKVRQKI